MLYKNIFVTVKIQNYSRNLDYFKVRLLIKRMIQVIPKYLIKFIIPTYPTKYTGRFQIYF